METMKRRTKAERRKKMAGMQKARDMMMVNVGRRLRERGSREVKRGAD